MSGDGNAVGNRDIKVEGFGVVKRRLDRVIGALVFTFFLSGVFVAYETYAVNRGAIESRLFPVTTNWTFRDWQKVPSGAWGATLPSGELAETMPELVGRWSAIVYFYKNRPECEYLQDQIVTARYVTPLGTIGETKVLVLGDISVGNSRAGGWHRMDYRVVFLDPAIGPGTKLRSVYLHRCDVARQAVSSGYTGVVVGESMKWPDFVQAWIDSGHRGVPGDFR